MRYLNSIVESIGNTPLVRLSGIESKYGLDFRVFAKLEMFNPAGSVKDRLALALVEDAVEKGLLDPERTEKNRKALWVEPTSGNTGIGLAFLSRIFGFRLVLTMPESMSRERQYLLAYLGADVVLTPADRGMNGAVQAADWIVENMGAYKPDQFANPANWKFHYSTTGPEIWEQTGGTIDIFVAGSGTGGTITGAGKFLKEQKEGIKAVVVEPEESAVISGNPPGRHGIQGIGPGFIPKVLDTSVIDNIIQIKTEEALRFAKEIADTEGMLAGISSGAALAAVLKLNEYVDTKGKNVVTVFPDTGERYLSTALFENESVKSKICSFENWRLLNE